MKTTDELVADYIRLRDALSEASQNFEAYKKKIKDAQEKITGVLLKHLNETESEAVRTKHGTFFKKEVVIPTASDWDTFYKWIAETDGFEFLERRIKRAEVASYMEQHKGTPPPGVSVLREYEVQIRRNDKPSRSK